MGSPNGLPTMSRRGEAIIGAALLALCIGFAAWQAVAEIAASPSRANAPRRTERVIASAAPIVSASSIASARKALAPRPTGEPAAFDPTANWPIDDTPLRAGDVEFCGAGRATADSPAARAFGQQAREQAERAAERLFAVMARSPDLRTRAAAQLARDESTALADAARSTQDPAIYAMALQACGRSGTPARSGHCAALSAQQMARLDPDNAMPWLQAATESLQRNDAGGVAEAVHRASLARASRLHEFQFTDLALSALPADWPPRESMLAAIKLLEIHAALSLPSYLAAVQYCAAERMPDVNLQQTCDRLARVLMERGDTLVDYGIGRRIGERAGWPAGIVETHNALFEAYKQSLAASAPTNSGNGKDCRSLRARVQAALAHSRRGERASAQAAVEAAGGSGTVRTDRDRAAPVQPVPTLVAAPP